jgi:N-methylhydantoinase A/oxoprolinase/acetone carboxylase beta subunit
VWIGGEYVPTPVFARERLAMHERIGGPALIEQYDTCTYVPPGWTSRNDGTMLIVERGNRA